MNRSTVIVVAPDKFKGSAPAKEVAESLTQGLNSVLRSAEVRCVPVADGGEGTVDAAVSAGFARHSLQVTGPVSVGVEATWALDGSHEAVVELAQASGIELLDPNRLAGTAATSRGTGEILQAALESDAQRIVLGLGGSASTDGGAGMLAGLGVELHDSNGQPVPDGGGNLQHLAHVSLAGLDPRWADIEVVLASDVDNPLLGPAGAAAVFGPQKGLASDQVPTLDAALGNFANLLAEAAEREWGSTAGKYVRDMVDHPGAGAAGGTGFAAMAALGAKQRRGIDVVLDFVDFPNALRHADLVITGEGSLDEQSLQGKTPVGVGQAAVQHDIPVYAVCGRSLLTAQQATQAGIDKVFALSDLEADPSVSMSQPHRLLVQIGQQIGHTLIAETAQREGVDRV